MNKFDLPNFDLYKPYCIEKSLKELSKSKLINKVFVESRQDEKYKIALNELIKNKSLSKKEIKILSYHLITLEKVNLFMDYYKIFVMNINSFIISFSITRQFISFLYNGLNKKNKEAIFSLLKVIGKRQYNKKVRYDEILYSIMSSDNLEQFLVKIQEKFSTITAKTEIDTLAKICFLKSTDSFYHNCISAFIINNYLDKNLWDFIITRIEVFKLENKKELFNKILLLYKDNMDIKSYPKNWFILIGKELGDPFETVNQRWKGLEEVKEIYRRWNVSENIDKFFDEIVGGDRDRKSYWRKYVNNIYRIEYFEEASKALVMEFQDHLFVEFATVGNAMYYYNKNDLSIDKIKLDFDSNSFRHRVSSKTSYLKQKYLALGKLNHSGYWQDKSDYLMSTYGYKKSR